MARWDLAAQAAMVLAFVHRLLTPMERTAVRAHYTVPTIAYLERRKTADMMLLYEIVSRLEHSPVMDDGYVVDSIKAWCGYPRQYNDKDWAKRLRASEETMRWWRHGDARRRWHGFVRPLNSTLDGAIGKLIEPMFAAGLTRI